MTILKYPFGCRIKLETNACTFLKLIEKDPRMFYKGVLFTQEQKKTKREAY